MTDRTAIERGVALVPELEREIEIGRKHDRWPMFPGPHCETIIAALKAAGEMLNETPDQTFLRLKHGSATPASPNVVEK